MQKARLILVGQIFQMHDFFRQFAGWFLQGPLGRIIEKKMINADVKGLCQLYHDLDRGRNLVVFIAAYLAAIDLRMIGKLIL